VALYTLSQRHAESIFGCIEPSNKKQTGVWLSAKDRHKSLEQFW